MRRIFRIHDNPEIKSGAIETPIEQAKDYNQQGFGIFHLVNEFDGPRRAERCVKLCYWYVDMESGDKTHEQRVILENSPCVPSFVIETKRGFHVYWKCIDATLTNYRHILRDRLIPYFNADPSASDVTRLLRRPGFFHMKDPKDPFYVDYIYANSVAYSEREMFYFFPDHKREVEQKKEQIKKKINHTNCSTIDKNGDFWDKVWSLNCEEALAVLSGSDAVGGEMYTFRDHRNGTKQILVNGKYSGAWIDHEGHIGSHSNGGPTIAQWLKWFGNSWKETIEIIKNRFPECTTSN